ncbi:MAG: zinc-dependent alcohol dehydrogenase [Streptosporangiales bacterium]
MRALRLRDFGELAVEQVPDPEPGPHEALVRITATGICGSDLHGFTGETGRRAPGQVMGHETVGTVETPSRTGGPPAGAVVTVNPVISCGQCAACRAGSEQACPTKSVIGVHTEIVSAFAELMAVPAGNLVELPYSMPEEYGALVEPLAVGYHALRRGDAGPGDVVLVVGAGPIGQACVLAARRLGAEAVAVSEPDPHRRGLAGALGAEMLDPGEGELATRAADALRRPPTLTVDAVGATASLRDALASTAPGGRVVLVGMATPDVDVPAYAVSTQERTVIGSFCYSAGEFRDTAAWVGGAPAELASLVEGRVDLAGAPAAFTRLAKGEDQASKVLVFPYGVPAAVAGQEA